jgi:hypothetical protein
MQVKTKVLFSREDLERAAAAILETRPDPVPQYRLLNEVLRLSPGEHELRRAKTAAEDGKWVKQLSEAQLPDGSWGRFHSQDSQLKSTFRTSEEAIDRAYALGLEPGHPVLCRARDYLENVLAGKAHITDREEKNEAWPLIIKLILLGRLAQIEPTHPMVAESWKYLAEVARRAFASGHYCLADEAQAHLELSGRRVPNGFLESQHALWTLASRPLPPKLEQDLVQWIWNKPDGIRYVRVALTNPQPRTAAYWLKSLNILSRFSSWRQVCADILNKLWGWRDARGYWDFGSQIARSADFPLSDNWRKQVKRKVDYSTCVLVVLRRWFD